MSHVVEEHYAIHRLALFVNRGAVWYRAWWAILCLVVPGCRSETAAPVQTKVGDFQGIAEDTLVERTPPTDTAVRVVLGPAEFRLSSAPGPGSVEFGWITAAELISDGGLVVLDGMHARLSRYGSDGRQVASIGRRGEGPGEFQTPRALSQNESGTLFLADENARRLYQYDLTRPGLESLDALPLTVWTSSICAMGNTVLGLAFDRRTQTIVHQLTSGTATPPFFGKPLFEEAALNATGTVGDLVCVPDQDLSIIAPDRTGVILGYGAEGTVRWRTSLRGYRPSLFEVVRNGTKFGFHPGQSARDVTLAAVRLSKHYLLVQTGTKMLGESFNGEFSSITSRILRLSDGKEVGMQEDLPRVAHALAGRLVTHGSDDDVWLEVRGFHVAHDPKSPPPLTPRPTGR